MYFKGEYRWLSNFLPCSIVDDFGIQYPSVEHAYQAAKTLDRGQRQEIADCVSPVDAKRLGRNVSLRPDWESIKLPCMYEFLAQKFFYPALRKQLRTTGDLALVEHNYWHDIYWGICTCSRCGSAGENRLGILLMALRQSFQGGDPASWYRGEYGVVFPDKQLRRILQHFDRGLKRTVSTLYSSVIEKNKYSTPDKIYTLCLDHCLQEIQQEKEYNDDQYSTYMQQYYEEKLEKLYFILNTLQVNPEESIDYARYMLAFQNIPPAIRAARREGGMPLPPGAAQRQPMQNRPPSNMQRQVLRQHGIVDIPPSMADAGKMIGDLRKR